VTRRRLSAAEPRFDVDGTLNVLRDNLERADAYISAAEDLIERPVLDDEADEGDCDDDAAAVGRRRNHTAHLIESAKLAVRAAICAGSELDRRRRGA
jgi:hypothetical protein